MSEQGDDTTPEHAPIDPYAPPPEGAPQAERPAYGSPQPPSYGSPQPPSYGSPQPPSYGSPQAYGSSPGYGNPPPYPGTYPGQAPYPSPYPGGGPGQWGGYPEQSQGVLALVLGLIGLFVFTPVAPFAWVIGNREVRGVDAGRRPPGNRGLGVAGKVLGIIGTIILVLVVIGLIILVVALVGASTTSSTT